MPRAATDTAADVRTNRYYHAYYSHHRRDAVARHDAYVPHSKAEHERTKQN